MQNDTDGHETEVRSPMPSTWLGAAHVRSDTLAAADMPDRTNDCVGGVAPACEPKALVTASGSCARIGWVARATPGSTPAPVMMPMALIAMVITDRAVRLRTRSH
jgi:hypothetical protein